MYERLLDWERLAQAVTPTVTPFCKGILRVWYPWVSSVLKDRFAKLVVALNRGCYAIDVFLQFILIHSSSPIDLGRITRNR